jgi:hypothetical protein
LSHLDRQFRGGAEPALLDVTDIDMLGKASHPYQPENHTIDEREYWRRVRRASFNGARSTVPRPRPTIATDSWFANYLNDKWGGTLKVKHL